MFTRIMNAKFKRAVHAHENERCKSEHLRSGTGNGAATKSNMYWKMLAANPSLKLIIQFLCQNTPTPLYYCTPEMNIFAAFYLLFAIGGSVNHFQIFILMRFAIIFTTLWRPGDANNL